MAVYAPLEYDEMPLRDEERFIARSVAARMVGCSIESLRRYERLGLLPANKLPGGHIRYRVSDVKSLITIM